MTEQRTKASGFFLIHNYNTVPEGLLSYCEEDRYLIMDASDDGRTPQLLREKGLRTETIPNTGHNITSYFSYFSSHYDTLPEVLFLLKGNILQRHCSRDYFERVLGNTWFTYLYEEKQLRPRYSKPTPETLAANHGKDPSAGSIASLVTESHFLEVNNDWYMETGTHPHRYFASYDDLLRFIYTDPVLPKQLMFAPGACYIVRREQIRQHGAAFYTNLNKLMNYTLDPGFPAEAYLVERMLPVIFEANYEVNAWMEDPEQFDGKTEEQRQKMAAKAGEEARRQHTLRHRLKTLLGR